MYFNSFPRAGYKWRDIWGWELIITFMFRGFAVSWFATACVRACVFICACVVCASMDMKRSSWLSRAITECRLRPRSAESKAAHDSLASAVLCSEPTECWSLRLCALSPESGHRQSITAITLDAPRPALRSYPSEFRARGRMIDEDVTKGKAWTRVRGEVWKRETILLKQQDVKDDTENGSNGDIMDYIVEGIVFVFLEDFLTESKHEDKLTVNFARIVKWFVRQFYKLSTHSEYIFLQ